MKKLLLLALCALAFSAGANVVHRPGLVQAQFKQPSDHGFKTQTTGVPILASNLVAVATAAELDFTPSVFMDYDAGDGPGNRVNPVSGRTWGWSQNYIVFAYEGEIFLEAGTVLRCYGRFDDGEALVIDGKTVVFQGATSGYNGAPSVATSFTADRTGWFPFNAWIWDWTGGKKPIGSAYALQWNTNGVTGSQSDPSKWFRFEDPLDMGFLRSTTGEAFTTVGTVSKNGDDLDVSLVCAGLPSGASLAACFGSADGGTAATSDWQRVVSLGSVATNDTGTATVSVTVPGAASAAALRFFLEGEKGTTGYFTEWTEPVALRSDPIVDMGGVVPSYTNGVATVVLRAMGLGVSENALTLEIAATETGFDDPLAAFPCPANPATSAGSFQIPFTGLETNTTYWARAVAVNDGGRGVSAPVSFTMLEPGFATGTLAYANHAFTSLSFTGAVTGWGADSSSADLTLEVSPDADFPAATTLSFPGAATLSGAVPASQSLVATGLAGDTAYHARLRIVNTWGLETVVPLAALYSTLPSPVELSDPGAVPAGDGVQTLSVSAVAVEPGTTYSVSLSVDGSTVKTWSGLSAAGSFSFAWSGAPGSSHNAVFSVSSSFGGRDFSDSRPFSFTVGATVAAVSDLADLGALLLRTGDKLVVPALGPGESLVYDTNAVVSAEGTVFTAREPGMSRIRRYGTDPVAGTNVLEQVGVLVVAPPDSELQGGLFVRRTGNSDFNWCSAASWEKFAGTGDWPNGAGDMALVYLPLAGDRSVQLGNADITLGYLGVGSSVSGNRIYFRNGTLTFRTKDGSESWIRMAGRNEGAGALTFDKTLTLANDLVVDGMGAKDMGLVFGGALDVGDHVFRTDRVPFRSPGDRYASGGQIQFNGDVRGSGEIVLRADSTASLGGFPARKSFTGTWNPASCNHNGNYGGSGLFLGNAYLGHAAAELKVSGAWFADKDNHKGASVRTGWSNGYQFGAPTNFWRGGVMPPKVTLDGGELNLITQGPLDTKYKDGIRDDWFEIGEFRLAAGPMGRLWSGISTWHNGTYPNSHLVVTNLVVEPGASAQLGLSTSEDKGYGIISNDFHVVNGPAAAWDSGKGYEILPFFYPNSENQNWGVPIRNVATGRVAITNASSSAGTTGIRSIDPGWGASGGNYTEKIENGSSWEALILADGRSGWFEESNSVVRVRSGFIGCRRHVFGQTDHANTASSAIDFGDRPGYVYVGYQNETATIGCRLVGTGGFVKSAGGTLTLHRPMDALAGGVWVDAGRLSLLDDATLGDNDVFVAAGAKLRIAGGDPFGTSARLDLEDRDWISTKSKLELDSGATNHVRRLFVNGENRHRGYYGSSEAKPAMSALATVGFPVFVDDAMFSGPGILKVKGDDLLQPSIMILR